MNVELKITAAEKKGQYYASAIVDGVEKPAHLMQISAYGELRTVGGNPNRYFEPADPLWWLGIYAGQESVLVAGELKQA